VPLVLVVSVATAVWDSLFGSWGNLVASCIYLVLLFIEIFWWPKWRDRLLASADRAADLAQEMLDEPKAP
jgi:membrane protein YdbS with pleckstrin-like domain